MGGGDGHKRSDSQPSYYFLQRTASLQRTESAMKGAEGGEVVELPPEGASSAEFDSRPVAARFSLRLVGCDSGDFVGAVDGRFQFS